MDKLDFKIFQNKLNELNIRQGKKLESITAWLESILLSLDVKTLILMPKKSDLAKLLNVGLGTIQNSYRILEDSGILVSKQCVGTYFVPKGVNPSIRKLTSKKDKFIVEIKNHILKSKFNIGDKLYSVRYYSEKLQISSSLVLQIFNQLENLGIIENIDGDRIIRSLDFSVLSNQQATLCEKIYADLKLYVINNFKVGDKLPPINSLSTIFNVSPKTVYSAIKLLQKDGILKPRSGRYGTVIIKIPNDKVFYQQPETSIFASSYETYIYHYERILNIIRKMIYDNFDVGSKLPSISELSMLLDVNPNTIRKCFDVLKEEGIVSSFRGRYGGTFVIELPDLESTQSYQWLAVNTDF